MEEILPVATQEIARSSTDNTEVKEFPFTNLSDSDPNACPVELCKTRQPSVWSCNVYKVSISPTQRCRSDTTPANGWYQEGGLLSGASRICIVTRLTACFSPATHVSSRHQMQILYAVCTPHLARVFVAACPGSLSADEPCHSTGSSSQRQLDHPLCMPPFMA